MSLEHMPHVELNDDATSDFFPYIIKGIVNPILLSEEELLVLYASIRNVLGMDVCDPRCE